MPVWNFVRRGFYQDSVTLMRLSRDMEAVAGVRRAAAMMGTPANRAILGEAGLLVSDGESAGPSDLVVAVSADTAEAAEAARGAAEQALTARPTSTVLSEDRPRPRTLERALKVLPDATLALISVPGAYAGLEATKALRAGLHVMLFSDNVPVETEIELKRLARERGLFLMGPDCGTAIVHGVPLGFANAVPRGRIGVAGASGTGVQQVTSLVATAGEGISHAIGVGGRDLSDAVGGVMMDAALGALAADGTTEVVCVIGKPPGPTVLPKLHEQIAGLGKPCVVCFVGTGGPPRSTVGPSSAPVVCVGTLDDAARAAVALARGQAFETTEFTRPADEVQRLVDTAARGLGSTQRFVRGVYAGGTLAWEARTLLAGALADVAPGVLGGGHGHRVVDLGEDMFTVGRPHPMIDGTVRREWIVREGEDAATAVVLLDVVLGYGAHPDPAGELLPAIRRVRAHGLPVVASVCGTDGDPQPRGAQTAALAREGVLVMGSNAEAVRLASRIALSAGARPADGRDSR
jgi:succinyl-CoA synthetase alpha subunit